MNTKDFIFPDFKHSIVNLAATMSEFVGHSTGHPVLPMLAAKLKPTYKNVVFMVIDGMGSYILKDNLPENSYFRTHTIEEVTSVFPSTTAAATTSLTSALDPSEHGWFAWSVDFDGAVIELFRNRNYYTHEFTADRDFTRHHLPFDYFFVHTNGQREIYSCFPDNLSSKIHAEHEIEFHSLKHMFRCLDKTCQKPNQKFIYCYFADLDTIMHEHGTTARKTRHLLKAIERKTAQLSKRHPDTLFVVTADHGQTEVKGFTYICDDAAIQACLAHPISLDPRAASFKIKPGKDAEFRAAFQKYNQDYALFTAEELIQKGVFGEFKLHPAYKKYLGDYIAIGTDTGKMLVFNAGDQYHGKKHLYHGIHTGMTPAEMMVPVIVITGGK